MPVRCCPECFDDRGLRNDVIPSLNPIHGTCSYCESENVALIEPSQLAEYFAMLVSIYEIDPDGKSLVEWMKTDWQLFRHPRMDSPRAKELLADGLFRCRGTRPMRNEIFNVPLRHGGEDLPASRDAGEQ